MRASCLPRQSKNTSRVGAFFSVCGKLVGHFPMCGWLRVVVAAIKRHATSILLGWDDEVRDTTLWSMPMETVSRVTHDDPVRGNWCIDGNEFTVWVDASSLALGVALAVDEFIVEDTCWLRPENDSRHISLAELDATVKGVNLALQWQARVLHIVTDSACVHQWITDALSGKARLTTRASSEMLIRRRLTTLVKTIREYNLTVDAALMQSCQNRADRLTREPHRWLDLPKEEGEPALANCATLAPYLFIICLDYILRMLIDLMKENGLILKKIRSKQYPAQTIMDYTDDSAPGKYIYPS